MGSIRSELVERNTEALRLHEKEFADIFGVPLCRFHSPIFGFDVIAFDRWLCTPDGVSTADTVLESYGQNAVDLCFRLIESVLQR